MPMLFNDKGFRPEPDSPKHRDYELLRAKLASTAVGDVDLRQFTSPRHDQGSTSSCVANATVKALEIKRIMKHGQAAHVDLSRLAVYYLARELMVPQETHLDDGTYVSHAFDVLRRFGVPPEADWPWTPLKVNTPPSWLSMRKAYLHKITAFYKIRQEGAARVQAVRECLSAGNPVVFGTCTGSNWHEYEKGQVLKMPVKQTGRHATVLVGYSQGRFIGENSWGRNWGDDGFYLMSPEVIENSESRDFWVPQAGWEDYR
jgi:C1A family cysteine protease